MLRDTDRVCVNSSKSDPEVPSVVSSILSRPVLLCRKIGEEVSIIVVIKVVIPIGDHNVSYYQDYIHRVN